MAMTIISQVDRLNYLNYLNYLTTITSQIDRLNYLNYLTNFTYFRQSSSQHQEGLHPAIPRRFTSRNTQKVYILQHQEGLQLATPRRFTQILTYVNLTIVFLSLLLYLDIRTLSLINYG